MTMLKLDERSVTDQPCPPDVSGPLLQVDGISKTFLNGPEPIATLRQLTFSIEQGEFVCLLGPSGSGKSTLLRIIGGLLRADTGAIRYCDNDLTAPHPEIGFVFQSTNLMPWRTVLQNVLLPLEIHQKSIDQRDRSRARAYLQLVGLDGFEAYFPRQLSGGMRQRAVLARTLLQDPRLMLLDEPFAALDALTRERLNLELLRIHKRQRNTVLMVTHSITEAVFLADRVLVLSHRPATIVADLAIDLPRPRTLEEMGSAHFGELATETRRILGHLQEG